MGLPQWIDSQTSTSTSIENTDVVLWHTFGLTHFPAPEDYPIMPAEPMTLLLRPRHFFEKNPCLDVRPSLGRTPAQVLAMKEKAQEASSAPAPAETEGVKLENGSREKANGESCGCNSSSNSGGENGINGTNGTAEQSLPPTTNNGASAPIVVPVPTDGSVEV